MPTYQYLCENCSHEFEKFQSITANALRKCPKCNKMKLKRLIGPGAGIIFKGTGFYHTDYRSSSYTSAQKKETTASSKTSDTTKKKDKNSTKSKKTAKTKKD